MISMDMGFDDPFWQKALAPDGVKQTIGTVLSDPPSCIIISRTLSIMAQASVAGSLTTQEFAGPEGSKNPST
ncbi:MAG: hypothetical protein VW474_13005 [Paracoccaceae bacterium]